MGKKWIAVVMTLMILLTNNLSVEAREEQNGDRLEQEAVHQLLEGFSKHYDISGFESEVLHIEQMEDKLSECILVTFYAVQKEKAIEEAPYIQGLCHGLGYEAENLAFLELQSMDVSVRDCLSANEMQVLTEQLKGYIEQYSQYIGVETPFCFYLKVEVDLAENGIDEESIVVYAENGYEYVPIEALFPESDEVLYENGLREAEEMVECIQNNGESALLSNVFSINGKEENYRKMVQYMNTYTSNPNRCDCGGINCEGMQDSSFWNLSQYPEKSQNLHNYCADYVSQAMLYAGVGTDSTWYKYSSVWMSVSRLKNYMINRGVWSQISADYVTTADVIDMGGHVVVVTYRDSSGTVKFSAHTHDRKDCVLQKLPSSGYEYFRINF